MKLQTFIKSILLSPMIAWWVEITTKLPRCTYYFGPFQNLEQAQTACLGYVEDLKSEQAQGIEIKIIKRFQPDVLTICDEQAELNIYTNSL
ncbi:MAG: DUF1816 domain-containing protein [Fischerella sp.]|nr:DUF1816 domain-containing protein [Fischerella sp.]